LWPWNFVLSKSGPILHVQAQKKCEIQILLPHFLLFITISVFLAIQVLLDWEIFLSNFVSVLSCIFEWYWQCLCIRMFYLIMLLFVFTQAMEVAIVNFWVYYIICFINIWVCFPKGRFFLNRFLFHNFTNNGHSGYILVSNWRPWWDLSYGPLMDIVRWLFVSLLLKNRYFAIFSEKIDPSLGRSSYYKKNEYYQLYCWNISDMPWILLIKKIITKL